MRTTTFVVALLVHALTSASASAADAYRTVLRFSTMYGVDGPFKGDDNAIRNIPGDDLPWVIDRVDGFLLGNGYLQISVRGLVFPNRADVPPAQRGINDEDKFRAIVSCLTEQGDKVAIANVSTRGFPASRSGNAFIADQVYLPDPCVAPIVFIVAADEDDWLAVTGVGD